MPDLLFLFDYNASIKHLPQKNITTAVNRFLFNK